MNVVIALSRPRTPILLMMSVVDHATENIPSAAGPSNRATRNANIPRKFDANIAIVFRNAPRLSSTPVLSTRAGASVAGGRISAISVVLADSPRSRSGRWAISMLYVIRKERVDSSFARNMLDVAGTQTSIRAHIASTLQSTFSEHQNFFARLTILGRGEEWISL